MSLVTNHKPVLGILSEEKVIPQIASLRLQRWAIILSGYNYTLQYKTWAANNNTDCLRSIS